MADLMALLGEPLQLNFMRHAFLAILLVGIICGTIGTFVTLRGLAFLGDAMAHAIFPGLVIAFVLGANFLIGALIAAVIVSVGIGIVTQSGRLTHDTVIGVFFAGAFALGITILSLQGSFARDVTSFLFGSILGVSAADLTLTAVVGGLVLAALAVFRRELIAVAFDRTFARSTGLNLWAWDQLFLLLLALTIVVSLQTVGNVLVLAMLVTPAATARMLTDRLPTTMLLAALIGAGAGIAGLFISFYAGVSSGASVVLVATALFGLVFLFAPKNGVITARVRHRLHYPHPERDVYDDADNPRSAAAPAAPPGSLEHERTRP
ncbi:MAG: metal ABC transporter permease [Chloroflexia bacterium]|nr:metal ABC transporter permease [Chloroflexia bacterium]